MKVTMVTFRPVLCGVLAFVLGEFGIFPITLSQASASEPLQISGQTNKLSIPGGASSGSTLSRSLDFFKRDSSAPPSADDAPMLSPSQERGGRNRKLQELIDRQKNWIFLTPETFNNGPTPADMFDKEESSAGPPETSSKVIENFWKEQDRQSSLVSSPSTRPRRSRDEKDTPALSETSSSPLSSTSPEKNGKLNWDGLFNPKGSANTALQPSPDIFKNLFNRPAESSTILNGNPSSPAVASP